VGPLSRSPRNLPLSPSNLAARSRVRVTHSRAGRWGVGDRGDLMRLSHPTPSVPHAIPTGLLRGRLVRKGARRAGADGVVAAGARRPKRPNPASSGPRPCSQAACRAGGRQYCDIDVHDQPAGPGPQGLTRALALDTTEGPPSGSPTAPEGGVLPRGPVASAARQIEGAPTSIRTAGGMVSAQLRRGGPAVPTRVRASGPEPHPARPGVRHATPRPRFPAPGSRSLGWTVRASSSRGLAPLPPHDR